MSIVKKSNPNDLTADEIEFLKGAKIPGEVKQSVEEFVRSSYRGKFFNAVDKDNLWFVNTNKLSENILERYPKLKSVNTAVEFPGTIHITLVEKPYQLVWCTNADCFLLSEDGALRDASVFFERKDEQGKYFTIRDDSAQGAGARGAGR